MLRVFADYRPIHFDVVGGRLSDRIADKVSRVLNVNALRMNLFSADPYRLALYIRTDDADRRPLALLLCRKLGRHLQFSSRGLFVAKAGEREP